MEEPRIEQRIEGKRERVHILTGAVCNNNCLFCMEEDRDGRNRERAVEKAPRHRRQPNRRLGHLLAALPESSRNVKSCGGDAREHKIGGMSETAAPVELPLRVQDEVECRHCEVHCEKVVHPGACLRMECPFVYSYEAWGRTYMGCLQKVFDVEIDLHLLEAA